MGAEVALLLGATVTDAGPAETSGGGVATLAAAIFASSSFLPMPVGSMPYSAGSTAIIKITAHGEIEWVDFEGKAVNLRVKADVFRLVQN